MIFRLAELSDAQKREKTNSCLQKHFIVCVVFCVFSVSLGDITPSQNLSPTVSNSWTGTVFAGILSTADSGNAGSKIRNVSVLRGVEVVVVQQSGTVSIPCSVIVLNWVVFSAIFQRVTLLVVTKDEHFGSFPCTQSFEDSRMYHLIGLVCGLAIYNSTIIDLKFPLALYKKLLKKFVEETVCLMNMGHSKSCTCVPCSVVDLTSENVWTDFFSSPFQTNHHWWLERVGAFGRKVRTFLKLWLYGQHNVSPCLLSYSWITFSQELPAFVGLSWWRCGRHIRTDVWGKEASFGALSFLSHFSWTLKFTFVFGTCASEKITPVLLQITRECYGETLTVDLISNGSRTQVNNENRWKSGSVALTFLFGWLNKWEQMKSTGLRC